MPGEIGAAGFHTTQARRRLRSTLLLGGTFLVLVGVVNALLVVFGVHVTSVCDGIDRCQLQLSPDLGALGMSVVGVAAYLMVAFQLATRSAIALTGARPAIGADTAETRNLLEGVSLAAGITPPTSYVIDDPAPNAFAAGTRRDHTFVAVTTGLLATMSRRELEGAIAHEVGHIVNKDTRVMTFAIIAAGTVAMLGDFLLRAAIVTRGGRDTVQLRAVLIGLAAGTYVVAYPLMLVLKATLSRQREVLADATAVELTRNPTGIRSALEKLEANPTVVTKTTAATAHLWIECPLSASGSAGLVRRLMSTHPPLPARIARLRNYEGLNPLERGPNDPSPQPQIAQHPTNQPGGRQVDPYSPAVDHWWDNAR